MIHDILPLLSLLRALVLVASTLQAASVGTAHAQDMAQDMEATPVVLVSPRADRERELGCLAQAIVYEAGMEPLEGQQAVAQVIMNRLRAPVFPKTVCGVVYQGSERRTGCQFTFTCDGSMRRRMPDRYYLSARIIAASALDGTLPDRVGRATNYHAYYVSPYWAPSLRRIGRIGAHIFYSTGAGGRRPIEQESATLPIGFETESPAMRPSPPLSQGPFSPWGLSLSGLPSSMPN
jgi:spore germination cell wall hydrolase CwlJ-like protein